MIEERASITFVKEHCREPLIVAEIGTWGGDNALNLLELNLDRLFLIDPYKEYPRHNQQVLNTVRMKALSAVTSHSNSYKTSFVRVESIEAAKLFPDEYFDYVYIDGEHTLDAVSKDLIAWWPKVKPGGIFAGHDYSSSVGVMRAVDNFCEENNLDVKRWAPPRTFDGPEHLADWLIVKGN